MEPEKRWGNNGCNYRGTPHFWNAIQKYGWNNFNHEILQSGLTKEEACKLEIKMIHDLKTQNREYGYNVMSGGNAPKISAETKRKMSIAMMGNQNGKGIPCSEEKKKKISDAQKGRKFTEEHKKKISEVKKGKPHKPTSYETKKKISDSHEKTQVYCVELKKVFPSIQQCAKDLKLYATNICKCCKNKLKSTGGYHFKYYN